MLLIYHRGNLNGIQKKRENSQTYINEALSKGYYVELDVRFTDDKFFLGHDTNPVSYTHLTLPTILLV